MLSLTDMERSDDSAARGRDGWEVLAFFAFYIVIDANFLRNAKHPATLKIQWRANSLQPL